MKMQGPGLRMGSGLTVLLAGCAPVIKDFNFDDGHPLHQKRIGVVFSRSGTPGSEGVDAHDLGEFLAAFGRGLKEHSRNATFIDLTGRNDLGPFALVSLQDTGLFGGVSMATYAVPDSSTLRTLPDSLDCLLLIKELSCMGGTPIADTIGSEARFAAGMLMMGVGVGLMQGVNPITGKANAPGMGAGFGPTLSMSDDGRGSADETTAFRYMIWDLRTNKAVEFNLAKMHEGKSFGSETTTFAQDGERMGQVLMRKLTRTRKPSRTPPKAVPGRTPGDS